MDKSAKGCNRVQFASFQSGGFITVIVVNPPESNLAKHTYVQWGYPEKSYKMEQTNLKLLILVCQYEKHNCIKIIVNIISYKIRLYLEYTAHYKTLTLEGI